MTNKAHVKYLDLASIQIIYEELYEFAIHDGEPIAPFERALVGRSQLAGILGSVAHVVFERELYPTISDKAAFLFYTIAKNHVFINGNKRMASLCVEIFLLINGHKLHVTADELTGKVLEIVLSDAKAYASVMSSLTVWVRDHIE
ncbi:MAG: type II toxin-antitoxin system death-on-curing family toxin [Patescibacteria group bacterium]